MHSQCFLIHQGICIWDTFVTILLPMRSPVKNAWKVIEYFILWDGMPLVYQQKMPRFDRGIPPAKWTHENVAQMRQQLQKLGLSLDWELEVTTCSSQYYQWTQWLFLQFLEAGLAYQKEAAVNWDPIDQTVLANEQVDSEGRSWRSGAIVERKLLKQWFFKITDYAEQLLQDLDRLTGWPERVKTMQANWIGKSVGAYLEFPIVGLDAKNRQYLRLAPIQSMA